MRSPTLMLFVAASAILLNACADEKDETRVWGTMWTDTMRRNDDNQDQTFEVKGGTLANEKADFYGYCTYENDIFSFAVGTAPKAKLGANSTMFELVGIPGKPSPNPYTSSGVPRSDENRTFRRGAIWTQQGSWSIEQSDIILDKCKVSLFAEASEGDLTPQRYGKDPFQYLLKVDCATGLDQVPNQSPNGIPLGGMQIELWFDNCT